MSRLWKCPACGAAVSESASACPTCGDPLQESGWFAIAIYVTVKVTLLLAGATTFYLALRHSAPGGFVFSGICILLGLLVSPWTRSTVRRR